MYQRCCCSSARRGRQRAAPGGVVRSSAWDEWMMCRLSKACACRKCELCFTDRRGAVSNVSSTCMTGCSSPSRVPFEFTAGWGELSIGGYPTWGRTVVCDVVVPVREFAPKCVEQMLEDQPPGACARARAGGPCRGRTCASPLWSSRLS